MYIKNMSSEEKMDEINYTYFNALEKLGTNVDVLLPLLRSLETVKNEYAVESVVKGFSQNVAIINNMFYDRENGNEDLVAKSCLNILQKVFRVNIVYMSDIAINNIISTLSKFNFIDNWNLVPNVSLKPHEDIKEKDEKFVYLVNGTTRTLDMPKKKNAKHIQIIKNLPIEVTEILEENLSDLTVKRAIKQYCQMNEGRQES